MLSKDAAPEKNNVSEAEQNVDHSAAVINPGETHPAESSPCDWFQVTTSLGEFTLALWSIEDHAAEPATKDSLLLRAARQLGRAESLLCLLEDWLGVPLDFAPGQALESHEEQRTVAVSLALSDANENLAKIVLYLPLDILVASSITVSPPPPELAALMRWDTLPCEINVASTEIPRQQLAGLEAGGVVLIPASFEPFWRCQVRIRTRPAPVFFAELDAGQQRLIFDLFESDDTQSPHEQPEPNNSDSTEENTRIDIVLKKALPIPVDQLFGWAEQPVFTFDRTLPGFSVMLNQSQQCLAEGDLIAIGNATATVCLLNGITHTMNRLVE